MRFTETLYAYLKGNGPCVDLMAYNLVMDDNEIDMVEADTVNPQLDKVREAVAEPLCVLISLVDNMPDLLALRDRVRLIDHCIIGEHNRALSLWNKITPSNMPPNPVRPIFDDGEEPTEIKTYWEGRRAVLKGNERKDSPSDN